MMHRLSLGRAMPGRLMRFALLACCVRQHVFLAYVGSIQAEVVLLSIARRRLLSYPSRDGSHLTARTGQAS